VSGSSTWRILLNCATPPQSVFQYWTANRAHGGLLSFCPRSFLLAKVNTAAASDVFTNEKVIYIFYSAQDVLCAL